MNVIIHLCRNDGITKSAECDNNVRKLGELGTDITINTTNNNSYITGACDQVVRVLRLYGCSNIDIAYYGCWSIFNLSSSSSSSEALLLPSMPSSSSELNLVKLGNAGACEGVVDVIKKYGAVSADVAFHGIRAIYSLGSIIIIIIIIIITIILSF